VPYSLRLIRRIDSKKKKNRQGFNFYNTTMTLQYYSNVIITKSGYTEDCFVVETSDQKTSEVA